ncbi:MAG TPA: YdcF family protein [bacterium]|nr:YdcF family protein [bacterium]
MRKLVKRYALFIIISAVILFWLPWTLISVTSSDSIIRVIDELPVADAVIIFGTRVDDTGEISLLLRERLEAGIAILDAGKAESIVVSNTEYASVVMAEYLLAAGISKDRIEIDTAADKTPDTCTNEINTHGDNRSLIFVSQGYHLPRLLYQCRRAGITGIAFPAESAQISDRPAYPITTILLTRAGRYTREASLTWLACLGLYR